MHKSIEEAAEYSMHKVLDTDLNEGAAHLIASDGTNPVRIFAHVRARMSNCLWHRALMPRRIVWGLAGTHLGDGEASSSSSDQSGNSPLAEIKYEYLFRPEDVYIENIVFCAQSLTTTDARQLQHEVAHAAVASHITVIQHPRYEPALTGMQRAMQTYNSVQQVKLPESTYDFARRDDTPYVRNEVSRMTDYNGFSHPIRK